MKTESLPPLPLGAWEPSRLHLQLMCQIVGKVRLALHPRLNHWWHVTLSVSPRGLTTGTIPYADASFSMELDLIDHVLAVRSGDGCSVRVPLAERSIADFYRDTMGALRTIGVEARVRPFPYKCKSDAPFTDDRIARPYDRDAVHRAWTVLEQVDAVFEEFRGRYLGKCSPVQLFWHSFDLAVTRFSGRRAPAMPDADAVTREAYSHEVISAGFWFGDDTIPEPAFYTYAAPCPPRLDRAPLRPALAEWRMQRGAPMAILRYDDLRRSSDPRRTLLAFLQSAYDAGATLGGWDRPLLERATLPAASAAHA